MKYKESGAGDPLILIHGFPFHSDLWEPQLANVAPGWHYIAPDLRGFGDTPLDGATLTMDRFADDIVALLDDKGIDQAVMLGLSMGGYVALSLVMRHPDRVRALVLAATRANADTPDAAEKRRQQAADVRANGTSAVIEGMLPKLFSAHSRMKLPETVAAVRTMMEATPPETMAGALEGMADRPDYTDRLGEIDVSTLVIRGEQDEIIPAGDMEAIARSVRGARQEVISLAGHLPNREDPEVFNNVLHKFLSGLPPAFKLGDLSLSF